MSDNLKHECGIAMIRLLKPLEHFQLKYGSWMYGLNKLYLLMEKQHNRGQDGAGAVCVKFDMHPGKQYINRVRSNHATPIKDVFQQIRANYEKYEDLNPELLKDPVFAKENLPFAGELYLGHLRYGTFGKNNIDYVHPVMRVNNWRSRNLVMAGNFNLTNVDELFQGLIDYGQHPKDFSDTVTILEMVGLFLDEENQRLFRNFKNNGVQNKDISQLISSEINIAKIIQESSKNWDGGYAVAGLIGHGDAFVARDPWGIRPASWYANNEMIVVASERAVIQTVMNVPAENVKELQPGSALVIKKDGTYEEKMIRVPQERKSCSFERIYFSRGSDQDIYRERKKLGENLVPSILKAIDYDFDNSVFSYIPNTAESAFYGMIKGLDLYVSERKKEQIRQKNGKMTDKELVEILHFSPRVEKIAIKDAKLRTFITEDAARDDMVAHVYDVTYGTVRKGTDNLVVIDDSIVRGTTLKQSILKILDRLGPKKIVIVSSAPQIRYPDCYGIDMAKLGDFIAFEAAIHLLKETGQQKILAEVYKKCKAQENLPKEDIVNYVKGIYKPFTAEQISKKIADLLTPDDIKAEVNIVFQSIEDLHAACPNDLGDWYFTGDYPTPGGNKVVNTAFINYIEGKNQRAY
ncbi:MAG: amidophosphoribosyltransferase [Bacteroidetes bacterium GWF2_38_335]|nr:MAG: amidophosphoribosyltransferase [Bacteroidetes bacterium GWF2_38_335]OFY80346.1 MAG: amidophosphoribosyltransferase [Bacteroidetes bacterium RIFOXYA12_FULL_38_20]HBS88853.1 amidophosphoribosyltransferase [Bacteroidales bacterium]